jgi:ABC-type sugar transport system substrate-binding protein
MGALQAIEAAGGRDDILIWGSTGVPAALNAVEEGKLFGTCWEDVYSLAKIAFNMALYSIETGVNSVSAGYKETPMLQGAFTAVTKENVKSIKPQTHWPEYS